MSRQIHADGSYPYLCLNRREAVWYKLLRRVIYIIFPPILRLFLGLRVEGWENLDALDGVGAVTVCNHVHPLDCVILACCCQEREMGYLSLKSNLEMPVVGKLIRVLNAVPVPDAPSGYAALRGALRRWLGQGKLFQIYPEGWLIPWCGQLRTFQKGSFAFAYDANAPVLPYVLCQRPYEGLERFWHRKPALTLRILPAAVPDTAQPRRQEVARLEDTVRAAMEQALHETSCLRPAHSEEADEPQPVPQAG